MEAGAAERVAPWSASRTGDGLTADGRVRVQARGPWPDLPQVRRGRYQRAPAVLRDELATDGIASDAAEELMSPATSTLLWACSG